MTNKSEYGHILDYEDPIEFVHQSQRCLVNQREVHRDTLGANEALRLALREDPIILSAEMRDRETISLALTAAETGHLVFGTRTPVPRPRPSTASSTCSRLVKSPWCVRCCPSRCGGGAAGTAKKEGWRAHGSARDHGRYSCHPQLDP